MLVLVQLCEGHRTYVVFRKKVFGEGSNSAPFNVNSGRQRKVDLCEANDSWIYKTSFSWPRQQAWKKQPEGSDFHPAHVGCRDQIRVSRLAHQMILLTESSCMLRDSCHLPIVYSSVVLGKRETFPV